MRKKIVLMEVIIVIILAMTTIINATNVEINNKKETNTEPIVVAEQENTSSETEDNSEEEKNSNSIGLIAAALATGLACIGSGIAVSVVASSAVGAISEKPELLGKTIIFAGLAEGIAIYGLIISIMILNKI